MLSDLLKLFQKSDFELEGLFQMFQSGVALHSLPT